MNHTFESEFEFFSKIKISTHFLVPNKLAKNGGLALYESKLADELRIERFSRLHHLTCYITLIVYKFLGFKVDGGFFTEGEPYDQFAQLSLWKVNRKYGVNICPKYNFFSETYNCSSEQAYSLLDSLIENNILAKIPNVDYSGYYFTEHFRKAAMNVSEYYKNIENEY